MIVQEKDPGDDWTSIRDLRLRRFLKNILEDIRTTSCLVFLVYKKDLV